MPSCDVLLHTCLAVLLRIVLATCSFLPLRSAPPIYYLEYSIVDFCAVLLFYRGNNSYLKQDLLLGLYM